MRFRLVESINTYYRMILYDEFEQEYVSLFRGLNEYIQELYDSDAEEYEDVNYAISQLEYVLDVPDLDFKNKNYNFAFTEKALTVYSEEFDELKFVLEEYSPYQLICNKINIDDKDIAYQDDLQVAWEIH